MAEEEEIEKKLEEDIIKLQSPEYAYYHAYFYLEKNRFIKGEGIIATNAEWAVKYAIHILKGRFKRAELIIADSSYYSYQYAKYALKKRFILGEKIIYKMKWHIEEYEEFLSSLLPKINPRWNDRKYRFELIDV